MGFNLIVVGFLSNKWNGSRFACASMMSVAEVFIAPKVVIAACLWILASFVIGSFFIVSPYPLFLCLISSCGVNMSAPYRKLGTTVVRYSHRVRCGGIPFVVLLILLIAISHFVPFSNAYATCSWNLSLSSIMMPRYFVGFCGAIC